MNGWYFFVRIHVGGHRHVCKLKNYHTHVLKFSSTGVRQLTTWDSGRM